MDDIERIGNLIEAGLWLTFTLILSVKAWQSRVRLRRVFARLAGAFLVFSVSDVIESHTGAWWRPVWLLLLKVVCVVIFYFCLREYYRIKKSGHMT